MGLSESSEPGASPKETVSQLDHESHRADPLSVVNAIAAEAARTRDLRELLELAVERMIALTGTEAGAALLVDEDTGTMHLAAEHNLPDAVRTLLERQQPLVGQGIPGIAAEQCKLLIVQNAWQDERELPPFREMGIKTHICIPLTVRGRSLGVLGLVARELCEFDADERALFTALGEQLGIAIERARLFERQEKLTKQLEEANRHKSEFLANLSHELRTPLNAILGGSELLAEGLFGEMNEKQAEYIHDINESGQHLLSLINDVLDLSKVEAGRLELQLDHFDLRSLMKSSATIVRERASRKSIDLRVEPPDKEVIVEADERKVKQIVYNLLSNAVKFTPDGGTVTFSGKAEGDEVVFSVEDTGPGVPEAYREKIFDEFVQVPGTTEGTGLGLALCKRLVELHGGRVWLASEVGAGSTFHVAIPISR